MVEKNWSLKKRWPLFAGGIFLLMLAYHGEAMVKSTHILDFYLEYRTPAPSSSNQLVERAYKDIIENISTSVNELGHINIDEG
ncbi:MULTISPECIES: hypothetical protein [unclassified Saccharibacter]|nr:MULTISPECIES: hypothetical protein [unclassified Saccharibacter]MXV36819.1 hypothetical protein [Saccharibacter sp. EH611]MXV66197.1 hypothetical protein [Saccharibacter sp. EH60]